MRALAAERLRAVAPELAMVEAAPLLALRLAVDRLTGRLASDATDGAPGASERAHEAVLRDLLLAHVAARCDLAWANRQPGSSARRSA